MKREEEHDPFYFHPPFLESTADNVPLKSLRRARFDIL